MTQEFSLTTEYQIAHASTIQAGYVGIIGHHLTDPFWGNQATSPTATDPYASIVGQGGVAKITKTESNSNYNGLQAVVRQRLTAGLELTANYTWSHSLTDDIGFYGVSNNNSNQYYQQNAYDMRSEWGPAGTDTRQNISVTGVYEVPLGRGKKFGGNWNPISEFSYRRMEAERSAGLLLRLPCHRDISFQLLQPGQRFWRRCAAQSLAPTPSLQTHSRGLLRDQRSNQPLDKSAEPRVCLPPGYRQRNLCISAAVTFFLRHGATRLAPRPELPEPRFFGGKNISNLA